MVVVQGFVYQSLSAILLAKLALLSFAVIVIALFYLLVKHLFQRKIFIKL
tara:strand:+ start:2019 stop:2168 length:150 start_codon:yes stop_codon:yes gene_type:complete